MTPPPVVVSSLAPDRDVGEIDMRPGAYRLDDAAAGLGDRRVRDSQSAQPGILQRAGVGDRQVQQRERKIGAEVCVDDAQRLVIEDQAVGRGVAEAAGADKAEPGNLIVDVVQRGRRKVFAPLISLRPQTPEKTMLPPPSSVTSPTPIRMSAWSRTLLPVVLADASVTMPLFVNSPFSVTSDPVAIVIAPRLVSEPSVLPSNMLKPPTPAVWTVPPFEPSSSTPATVTALSVVTALLPDAPMIPSDD